MNKHLQAIILAAGKSTRFNTKKTKLAETICGQPMILYPTKLLEKLKIPTTVVIGYQRSVVKNIITKHHGTTVNCVVQEKQEGTGHALATTQHLWNKKNILVLNGDAPLLTDDIVTDLYKQHIKNNAAISFVKACNPDPTSKSYGRIVKKNNEIKIVEAKDFTGDKNKQCCINAGIYLIDKDFLKQYIASLDDNNASKEFYITDLVHIASKNNYGVATIKAPFDTIRGINNFQELWAAEQIKRSQLIKYWMDNGVRFSVAQSTHVDLDITIGAGSSVGCGTQLLGKTKIGKSCIIGEFCILENAIVADNVTINSHTIIKNSRITSHEYIKPFTYLEKNIPLTHANTEKTMLYSESLATQSTSSSQTQKKKQKSTSKKGKQTKDTFFGARVAYTDITTEE